MMLMLKSRPDRLVPLLLLGSAVAFSGCSLLDGFPLIPRDQVGDDDEDAPYPS